VSYPIYLPLGWSWLGVALLVRWRGDVALLFLWARVRGVISRSADFDSTLSRQIYFLSTQTVRLLPIIHNEYPQTTQITKFLPSADREITPWRHLHMYFTYISVHSFPFSFPPVPCHTLSRRSTISIRVYHVERKDTNQCKRSGRERPRR
jgi:hypothetical protein